MRWTSVLAIYFILWFLCLFFILPLRLTKPGPDEPFVAGQAESAPQRFSFARTALWTSVVAAGLLALFALNYQEGWVTATGLDFFS